MSQDNKPKTIAQLSQQLNILGNDPEFIACMSKCRALELMDLDMLHETFVALDKYCDLWSNTFTELERAFGEAYFMAYASFPTSTVVLSGLYYCREAVGDAIKTQS